MTGDPVFFVNAFTVGFYQGNVAAVVKLEDYPANARLLALAREFGWSETAFLKRMARNEYQIRWFTPEVEVPLCGHATLASAQCLFAGEEANLEEIRFQSRSGVLSARKKGASIELDFPADPPHLATAEKAVLQALGPAYPSEALLAPATRNLVVVYPAPELVLALRPDFATLAGLEEAPYFGIAATARGNDQDYICRYFAPREGINEDPVTGSAQTFLAPYWAEKLQKKVLRGFQASARGGSFEVEVRQERVLIRGRALIWLEGQISPKWRI
ncbi:MAG: PhzF family phenazine biosynthesis protein [Candidatus Syntrophosphaera sp.]|nr:PhzF family phenazine biosynthesis protein [Candidatus Syntrophosphaera sp.]